MKKKPYVVVCLPDIHGKYHDKQAVNLSLKVVRTIKPDEIILMGDFLEMEAVSRWKKNDTDVNYLKSEFDIGNKLLDRICPLAKKVTYLCGNHELWLNDYINNKAPELKGLISLEQGLKFDERKNLSYVEHNVPHRIGNKLFIHGAYTNKHHAQKHGLSYLSSITYGHTHGFQSVEINSYDKQMRATSIGCLCKKNKEFLQGRPTSWIHMMQVNYFFSNGKFKEANIDLDDGFCVFGGKTIKA